MAVVDAGLDVEGQVLCFVEEGEGGAEAVLGEIGFVLYFSHAGFEHAPVAEAALFGFGVPGGEVGDGDPGGGGAPGFGGVGGHDEGHVAAAGAAEEEDAALVDFIVSGHVLDSIEDVLAGEGGGAGLGAIVGAAEFGGDEGPVALLGLGEGHLPGCFC